MKKAQPPTLLDLVDLYLVRCRVEGKSPNTTHAYAETLGRFLALARREGFPADPRRIAASHLYAYLDSFAHLALESRHRYFREVRCFFNWLVDAGYLKETPFRAIKNVRLPQRIVRPYTPDDVGRLLACCDPETPIGARDRAIVLTLLDTGMRCSEMVQLTLDDVDLPEGRLRILHGKGNKQRVAPFAGRCREAIELYLTYRRLEPGPLFCATSGGRALRPGMGLRSNGLKHVLRRLGRKAGLEKVHAHRFRHTFATWAIEQDARELDVQYLLGHASPDMVRRYASSYNVEQAARRHAAFSPAERFANWAETAAS